MSKTVLQHNPSCNPDITAIGHNSKIFLKLELNLLRSIPMRKNFSGSLQDSGGPFHELCQVKTRSS